MEEDAAFLAAPGRAGGCGLYLPPRILTRRWTAIPWPPTARWTTGDLTCPPFPPGRTPNGRAVGNDFTADVRVRRAINIGIDRQEMIDNVLNGYGTPAYSICDQLPWYNPASEVAYDPEGAAALLDEAGWRDGRGRRPGEGRRPSRN